MRRRYRLCVLILLGSLATLTSSTARGAQQAPPELTAPVNDFANVIDGDDEERLSTLIRALQAASGDVIVVATVKTLQPAADIRVYANEMFENHGKGIGQKGKDNGMLVLLAVDDREVWAEVGYDLESIITDGFAGETSRQTMVPFFKQGDYGGGLRAGVTVFAQRIARARNVTLDNVPPDQPAPSAPIVRFAPVPTLFMLLVIFHLLRTFFRGATRGRRGRRRWGSMVGPFGSGYGGWSSGGRSSGWSGGGGFGGGFGGFGGGRSGGGGGGASW
jgi:uncharacterized protein